MARVTDWATFVPDEAGLLALAVTPGGAAALVLAALAVHRVLAAIARRLAWRTATGGDELLRDYLLHPLRWIFVSLAKLVEEPIEKRTRQTSQMLDTVFVHVDHAADIAALREAALEAVRSHKLWDGRAAAVQVTDMTPETLEVRVLMSARGGPEMFDLRCDVREAVVAAMAKDQPQSLARARLMLEESETP